MSNLLSNGGVQQATSGQTVAFINDYNDWLSEVINNGFTQTLLDEFNDLSYKWVDPGGTQGFDIDYTPEMLTDYIDN